MAGEAMFEDTGEAPVTADSAPTLPPSIVRIAMPEDELAILEMLHEGHDENGLFSFSDKKALETIKRATERRGGIIGLIDGPDGKPVAAVYLILDNLWYTEKWHLSELFAFVLKPYRASSYATDLIDWAKKISDAMHLPMTMGILSTKRTEAKVRLYRRFMKPIGAFFGHNLKLCDGPIGIAERE